MVYKLEGKELEEYLAVEEPFIKKLAEILFKGFREAIEKPGAKIPLTIDGVTLAVDNDLFRYVTPKIVLKIDELLAKNPDLYNKNKAIKSAYDQLTDVEKQEVINNFYKEQHKSLKEFNNSTGNKNKSVADELANIFGGKIDPKIVN